MKSKKPKEDWYEREYVEHLQKQIQKQAELIDSQFIVIRGLMNNCYKDKELVNCGKPPLTNKDNVVGLNHDRDKA